MLDLNTIPYVPKEKKQYSIISAGECSFEIIDINLNDVDFHGKPSIRMTLMLKKNEEKAKSFINIPHDDILKIKELCQSVNKMAEYESKKLKNEDFIGCKGMAINYINEFNGIKRNKIRKFLKNVQQELPINTIVDDDIPF